MFQHMSLQISWAGHRVHLHRCHSERHPATPQRCGAGESGGIHSATGVGGQAAGTALLKVPETWEFAVIFWDFLLISIDIEIG